MATEALYVETSAVLAWLLGEKKGETARRIINDARTVVTSALTILEAERALIRAEIDCRVKAAGAVRARAELLASARAWFVLEVGPDVRTRAALRFPKEPVRALDAIHLSTALAFVAAFPVIRVLSFDDRIVGNLELLGLANANIENPI